MKYFILFTFFINALLAATDQTAQIAQKLSSLEQELYNHKQSPPNIVYDPFYPKTKKSLSRSRNSYTHTKKHKKRYFKPNITMILNKKAFINGKWYKENMKIADYVIYKISEDTVFLKKRGKIITLRLSPSKSILTAKEE